jgi:hypothetical protein
MTNGVRGGLVDRQNRPIRSPVHSQDQHLVADELTDLREDIGQRG